MLKLLLVILGGGIGALTRYAMLIWANKWSSFPHLPLLLANSSASFFAGFLVGLPLLKAEWRLLLLVGLLGGLSSFSTYATLLLEDFLTRRWLSLLLAILGQNISCLALAFLGYALAERLTEVF